MRNGSNFVMFYSGTHNNVTDQIGLATSADGVNWTKYPGNPVLEVGGNGSWDSSSVDFPSVIWNGTEYLMYYNAFGASSSSSRPSIGVAFSRDLLHWQKYAHNPILAPGPSGYDNVSVTSTSVMYDPPVYRMWYSGRFNNETHSINYATSTDGIHWTKYSGNPVMTRSTNNGTYRFGPWGPSVVKIDSLYFAAYETDGILAGAISQDGIHWTAGAEPLLLNTNSSTGYDWVIENPTVVLTNSSLYLWYTGFFATGPMPFAIDLATCSLSPIVITNTVTLVSTSVSSPVVTSTVTQTAVSTATIVSQSTVTQTSTVTQAVQSSPVVYQAVAVVLAVFLAATLLVLSRRGRQ